MRSVLSLGSALWAATALLVQTGCATTQAAPTASHERPAGSAPPVPAQVTNATPAPTAPPPDTRPVYFAFDSASLELSADDQKRLRAVGAYLVANPSARLVVVGHTDEVGPSEYNLALGDRRARAMSDYLTRLGVPARQLSLVSYGEERPAADGTGESVWASNRRDELNLDPGSG